MVAVGKRCVCLSVVALSCFSITNGQREERPLEGGFGTGVGFALTKLGQAAASEEGALLKEMTKDYGGENGQDGWALDMEMRAAVVEETFEEWVIRMQNAAQGEKEAKSTVWDGDDFPMRTTQRFLFDDKYYCNAVLLTNSIVLTSRHCLQVDENNVLPELFFGRSRFLIGEPGTHQWNFKARFKRVEWSSPAEGWALLELEDKTVMPHLGWLGVRWTNRARFAMQEDYPMLSNIAFYGSERSVMRECRVQANVDNIQLGSATCSAEPGSGALITLDWMRKPVYPPYVSGWFADDDNSFIYTDSFRLQLHKAIATWGSDLIELPDPDPITTGPITIDPEPDTFPPRFTEDPTRFTIDPITIPPVDKTEFPTKTTQDPTRFTIDPITIPPVDKTEFPTKTTQDPTRTKPATEFETDAPDTVTDLPEPPSGPIAIPAPKFQNEEEGDSKWLLPLALGLLSSIIGCWCVALLRPCCTTSKDASSVVEKDATKQDFADDESVEAASHSEYLNVA